jgi:hypothetical protein
MKKIKLIMEDVPQKVLNVNHIILEESPRKSDRTKQAQVIESDSDS